MPPRPAEGQAQHELLLLLRYHIDTAMKYPNEDTVTTAVDFAVAHPRALRGRHFAHLLGVRRWKWLAEQNVYPQEAPSVTLIGPTGHPLRPRGHRQVAIK